MTLQTYGTFGFLNPGQLAEEPLMLLDFGIEKRQSEKYDFYNDDRDYDGFLFQYTFQGEGVLILFDLSINCAIFALKSHQIGIYEQNRKCNKRAPKDVENNATDTCGIGRCGYQYAHKN